MLIKLLIEKKRFHETVFLGILTLFCFSFSIFRYMYTDTKLFLFLNWNLFLAFIPYSLTSLSVIKPDILNRKFKIFILSGFWLLFFPNSPYSLTDLEHLFFKTGAQVNYSSGSAEQYLLNQPVDISEDFMNFANTYFIADSLYSFDPATGSGTLKWKRHIYKTNQAFNNMLAYLRPEKGNVPYEDTILDLSNPQAVAWYQDKIAGLLKQGVGVIKVDFGEAAPAAEIYDDLIYYTIKNN